MVAKVFCSSLYIGPHSFSFLATSGIVGVWSDMVAKVFCSLLSRGPHSFFFVGNFRYRGVGSILVEIWDAPGSKNRHIG